MEVVAISYFEYTSTHLEINKYTFDTAVCIEVCAKYKQPCLNIHFLISAFDSFSKGAPQQNQDYL